MKGLDRHGLYRHTFRFFLTNAGYATPPGRIACAAHLARAEEYALDHGWGFIWEPDPDGDLGNHDEWCKNERRTRGLRDYHALHGHYPDGERPYCCSHESMSCCLTDAGGNVLASLGGILDADMAYSRVVQAELAYEAMSDHLARAAAWQSLTESGDGA